LYKTQKPQISLRIFAVWTGLAESFQDITKAKVSNLIEKTTSKTKGADLADMLI
jgi:hypothetical protein